MRLGLWVRAQVDVVSGSDTFKIQTYCDASFAPEVEAEVGAAT